MLLFDCNKVPPLAASYQSTVLPPGAVALNVAGVALWHTVTFELVGAAGFGFTVRLTAVRMLLVHPVVVFLDSA